MNAPINHRSSTQIPACFGFEAKKNTTDLWS